MSETRLITVSGQGNATVAPDRAVVSLAMSGNGAELEPVRADVNRRTSAVLEWLRGLGLDDGDVSASDVGIHPEYDHRRGQRLIGYRVVRGLTVTVRDLERLGPILDGVVAAGANEVHGAEMVASDPSAARHAALRAAVDAARAAAEAIAEAGGVTLGPLAAVEEGAAHGFPMPRMRAMAAGAIAEDASTEVEVGSLTVTATVRASFLIE